MLGKDPEKPDLVVATNGGSDLVYLPSNDKKLAAKTIKALLEQDYVSGLFVDDSLGRFPIFGIGLGVLPFRQLGTRKDLGPVGQHELTQPERHVGLPDGRADAFAVPGHGDAEHLASAVFDACEMLHRAMLVLDQLLRSRANKIVDCVEMRGNAVQRLRVQRQKRLDRVVGEQDEIIMGDTITKAIRQRVVRELAAY